jgi:aspartyl-tRNA(Asn)/glutamyl-tRNA(Gln) amidotransferase subunit C
MAVDEATTRRVAHLARIAVAEDQLAPLAQDLSRILAFAEQLGEVDVTGVEPMTAVTPMRLRRRADVVTEGDNRDAVLANAPAAREGFFTVPKVVE